MSTVLTIVSGPDSLQLAYALLQYGEESEVKLSVRDGRSDPETYLFRVEQLLEKNPMKGYVLKGKTAHWNAIPMGHGTAHAGPWHPVTVRYHSHNGLGTLTFDPKD